MSQAATNLPTVPTDVVALGSTAGAPPVVTLTPEQTNSKVVELRDAAGNILGVLFRDAGMAKFYSPEDLAELNRLAQTRERGRTLREVLDAVERQAAARQEPPG